MLVPPVACFVESLRVGHVTLGPLGSNNKLIYLVLRDAELLLVPRRVVADYPRPLLAVLHGLAGVYRGAWME